MSKENKFKVILILLIIVDLAWITYCFAEKKEGWHSDEVWSYGYANSYYQAQLFADSDGNSININEWVDSKELRDYVEVNDGERFAYGSVYSNQVKDLSPPLHSMLLHTICSFFPNTFSWWYSYLINVVSFMLCMIFLYKTANVMKNEKFGILCCFVYGISLAARDTYIYLRMYAMCTAMTMILLYNMVSWLNNSEKNRVINRNFIGVFVVSFLMFFTHYYMISFVGILTACVCFMLLCRRQIKKMLAYGVMELMSLGMLVAVYPSVIKMFTVQISNPSKGAEDWSFHVKMRLMANYLLSKLCGIKVSIFADFTVVKATFVGAVFLIIIMLPLCFLFRESERFVNMVRGARQYIKNLWVTVKNAVVYICMLITVIMQAIVVALTVNVMNMGQLVARYLMNLYPLCVVIAMGVLYALFEKISKSLVRKMVYLIALFALTCINVYAMNNDIDFYFKLNTQGVQMENVLKEKNVVFVSSGNWSIVYMTPIFVSSDMYFQTLYDNYMDYENEYQYYGKDEVVLVIDETRITTAKGMIGIAQNAEEYLKEQQDIVDEVLDYYKDILGAETAEEVSTETVFTRTMVTYIFK